VIEVEEADDEAEGVIKKEGRGMVGIENKEEDRAGGESGETGGLMLGLEERVDDNEGEVEKEPEEVEETEETVDTVRCSEDCRKSDTVIDLCRLTVRGEEAEEGGGGVALGVKNETTFDPSAVKEARGREACDEEEPEEDEDNDDADNEGERFVGESKTEDVEDTEEETEDEVEVDREDAGDLARVVLSLSLMIGPKMKLLILSKEDAERVEDEREGEALAEDGSEEAVAVVPEMGRGVETLDEETTEEEEEEARDKTDCDNDRVTSSM
jgi:hypothetical protein